MLLKKIMIECKVRESACVSCCVRVGVHCIACSH